MNKKVTVNWVRPNIENERGEIERVIKDFLLEEPNSENIKKITDILTTAPMVELSDKEWEVLENTDSFHNVRPGHIEDAEQITKNYNKELPILNRRNFKDILSAFTSGKEIEAPTIMKNKKGKLHLISGNTRLMIAKALGIRPKVVMEEVN